MTARLKTHTLGCKVNQYETELVRESLLGIGYVDAARNEPADLCVVNTCTVTAQGDRKSRQIIRRLNRQNPDARIVVMGCYATRAPGEVARLPGVSEIVTDKRELPDLLGRFGVVDAPNGISGFANRHRAYVKVQDGCLLRCSYCIIPHVRPEMYSRPPDDVLQEVRRLAERGFREIVLTGIHLGHYGVDFNRGKPRGEWVRLARLVRDICHINSGLRVRLSSIEATEVTDELIEVMAEHRENVCPHLHVCLQSGSDAVLRRMRRRWSVRQIIDRCERVRQRLDLPAFTTDVIVGFPGERDEDFRLTLEACRAIGFSKIHVFPFSPRRGTPAAEMSGAIEPGIKSQRCRELSQLEIELRENYAGLLAGRRVEVLVERCGTDGEAAGTTCRFLPASVTSPGMTPIVEGQRIAVRVNGFDGKRLLARRLQESSLVIAAQA